MWSNLSISNRFNLETISLKIFKHIHTFSSIIAIPDDADNSYSQCEMFNINYDHLTDEDINNWNRSLFPKTKTIRCQHGWVYDKSIFTSSLVSQVSMMFLSTYLFY